MALHELGRFDDALVSYDRALALDPDSPSLVSASFDRSVRVWDVRDGRLRWTFELPRVPRCCTVSRGGSIALAFGTKNAVIWEMERAV